MWTVNQKDGNKKTFKFPTTLLFRQKSGHLVFWSLKNDGNGDDGQVPKVTNNGFTNICNLHLLHICKFLPVLFGWTSFLK
jgi:hypothetical protein